MNIKFRDIHVQRRSVEDFDAKVSEMRTKAKIEIESKVPELREKILAEVGSSERIDPKELSRIYGLDEAALIDLQVIDPLQKLHE